MRRITDTELVRNYCENHLGDIFDINFASEKIFPDIPHVNLRKIVSRLAESGLLRTISKGVYIIGKSELSDEEIVIKHYLVNDYGSQCGIASGEFLLYKEGFCSKEPLIKQIKTNNTKGNKNIGNVQIIETQSLFGFPHSGLVELMELIDAGLSCRIDDKDKYSARIQELLKQYTDDGFRSMVRELYSPRVYYELENYLNSMQISHRVKEIYAIQFGLYSKK